MATRYQFEEEFLEKVRRLIRVQYKTDCDVFTLGVISRADYRTIQNLLEYSPEEYYLMKESLGHKQNKYPSINIIRRILRKLGYDIELRIIAT